MAQKAELARRSPTKANNGLKNDHYYTVAMARTSAPHSATAQFFINTTDNGFLNFTAESSAGWGYAVFGKVVEGKNVVDAIEKVKTGRNGGHGDVPLERRVDRAGNARRLNACHGAARPFSRRSGKCACVGMMCMELHRFHQRSAPVPRIRR